MTTLSRKKAISRRPVLRKSDKAIPFTEALRVLLAAEAATDLPKEVRDELPAIISHWLQSRSEPPILLNQSFSSRWEVMLSEYAASANWTPSKIRAGVKQRPVHIDYSDLPLYPSLPCAEFTFFDLFAGIGGFRIGLENCGGKCVFSSEWNEESQRTYFENFGEVPFGDIKRLSSRRLIDYKVDVVAGGFPCQPFSLAGVSARNSHGQRHGFDCEDQGQLFFDIVRIAKTHRPKMLLLENVGNLTSHDKGRTFQTIKDTIENDLEYHFYSRKYNCNSLVPQSRVRCIIVALEKPPKDKHWEMPELSGPPLPLGPFLEKRIDTEEYTISDALWEGHKNRSRKNVARGVGFTAYERDLDKPAPTLVARYYKDGKECLIPQRSQNPRMLTELECARLQGFPETFVPHQTKSHAYRQFGNSVPVPLVEFVAKNALEQI
jgi:DNA (cytosine-5)-methyltransferase 1